MRLLIVLFLGISLGFAVPAHGQGRPRLLVLTDTGGDPDDQQSMIRLMLFSNEFEIEGLIASASGTPGELKEKVTKPHLIREIVEAYGQVRPNLVKHAQGYPEAEHLASVIKSGNAERGRNAVGEGKDTEGSKWIIAAVDREDPRPLNISIWGGQTDLAQALWRVRQDRGREALAKFIARFRVYDIADPDGIAEWMQAEFPGMFYVLAMASPGRDKREGAFRGMYLGGDESLISREWMEREVRRDHGPLGALYPARTWTAPNPYGGLKEGDTPSWLYFLDNGLNDPGRPEWGGFGGRFERVEGTKLYRDAKDKVGDTHDARATVWRWRPAVRGDFEARLDWCVKEVKEANHAPVAVMNGDRTKRVVHVRAERRERVKLSAEGSTDPDGDGIGVRWLIYREAGTYAGSVELSTSEGLGTEWVVPDDAGGKTIQVVMEVRDKGRPGLYNYRRAVVTVE